MAAPWIGESRSALNVCVCWGEEMYVCGGGLAWPAERW